MNNAEIIAKKYAQAFLNIFIDDISMEDFHNFCDASHFFSRNKQLLFFLAWPAVHNNVKVQAMHQAFERFKLGKPFTRLIDILSLHKRTYLVLDVLKQLCSLYKERKGIMLFTVAGSHKLANDDLEIIKQFLANVTGRDIIYNYAIDKNLIAGIRMQSDTFLWEYSINRQLAQLKVQLAR
jgi:F-type H+-transporting ATPase subunit delta